MRVSSINTRIYVSIEDEVKKEHPVQDRVPRRMQDLLARAYLRRFADLKERTRAVREADMPRVLEIYHASFKGGAEEMLRRLSSLFQPIFYVVDDPDGTVVGYAAYYLRVYLSGLRPFREATLFSIAVHGAHRGQGLGNLLLKESIDEMRRNSVDMIHLYVNFQNQEAISLYERHGFTIIGTMPDICGQGAVCYRMDLPLRG
jgi:ribosomal-protein-alanine N-acetyltransferase